MQELASFTVLAEPKFFEVGTYFSFVVLVDSVLISEFVLVVSKGALPYQTSTD